MTPGNRTEVVAHVTAAAKGVLSSRPRLSRASLVRWARAEARSGIGITRLSSDAAREIDRIVDEAIAASR